MNKSCFKDCFCSFSHVHVFSFFFRLRPLFPPSPLKVPPLPVSVEHCLSFDCFRFPSCEFRSSFCFPFFNFISLSPLSLPLQCLPFSFSVSFLSISLVLCVAESGRSAGVPSEAEETYQFSPRLGASKDLFRSGSVRARVQERDGRAERPRKVF